MSTEQTVPFDHSGSSLDDFLVEDGILDVVERAAIKRVIAWQSPEPMNNAQPGTKQIKPERPR